MWNYQWTNSRRQIGFSKSHCKGCTNKYCLILLCHRSSLLSETIKNTLISHTVALADMLFYHDEHKHCSLFLINPAYTISVVVNTHSTKTDIKVYLLNLKDLCFKQDNNNNVFKCTPSLVIKSDETDFNLKQLFSRMTQK